MRIKNILAIIIGCLASVILLVGLNSTSLSATESCNDIKVIFARGSGQDIGDKDAEKFFTQIRERLPAQLSSRDYDLGTRGYDNYQYPAIDIGDFFVKVRAKISAGYSYEYGDSVKEGVGELTHYLKQQHQNCPDAQYVLGGFSQGAQVIGQSLGQIPERIRDKIAFAALFGDPKLHLPEGKGLFPPACAGRDLSAWRRVVEVCTTSAGALEAREGPYVPEDMVDKVGTWCLSQDYICGSTNLPWEVSGHDKYKEPGGSIEQAAQEIAQKLKTTFTYQSHKGAIVTAPRPQQKPPMKNTLVLFIVDRTVNMQSDYPNYFLPKMRQLAQSLGPQTMIGFDGYTGCWYDTDEGKGFPSVILARSPTNTFSQWQAKDAEQPNWISTDTIGIESNFPYFSIEPGCDLSWELGIHSWRAVNNVVQANRWFPSSGNRPWFENSPNRIIVPVTNTPYYPNDTPFRSNKGLLTQATSPSQDKVVIYPLVPDEIRHTFQALEQLGNAQVHLVDDDKIAEEILKSAKNPQLEARLAMTNYQIVPNSIVTFDASPSLVHDDTIAKYEWDFDGDSIPDATTTQPSVSHTYSDNLSLIEASVRVTSTSGLSATTVAQVQIIDPNDLITPNQPANLQIEKQSPNEARLIWQATDDLADKWLLFVNDLPAGYVEKDQHSVDITDIRSNEATTLTVQAFSNSGQSSEKASTSLPIESRSLLANTPTTPKQPQQEFQTIPTTTAKPLVSAADVLGTVIVSPKTLASHSHVVQQTHNSFSYALYPISAGILVIAGVVARAYYRQRRSIKIAAHSKNNSA